MRRISRRGIGVCSGTDIMSERRDMKKKQDKINDALLKVALGCKVAEVTEEYAEVDGELKLTKRKETKKDIPPDLKAVQLLLAGKEEKMEYAAMSDEELEEEKKRLLTILAQEGQSTDGGEKTREGKDLTIKESERKNPTKKRRMKRAGSR